MKIPGRKIIKTVTPPVIWNAARSFLVPQTKQYRGNFKNWEEAKTLTTGYDTPLILEKVKNAALKVKRGESAYERDSVNFDRIEYFWPLLASLLWIASKNDNRLSVADFGGSLGSSYYQNRKFLEHLKTFSWNVVEQKHFAEFGNKNLADEHLKFYDDLRTYCSKETPDVFLLSSVLPYVEKPYDILQIIKEKDPKYIIIDRTPFFAGDILERITVQQSSKKIYDASYPAWFFNEKKFLDFFSSKYELVVEWPALGSIIHIGKDFAEDKGFLLKRK